MEEEKESDVRVPLVFTLFCLFVTAGGAFLVVYVFVPSLSRPWYPIAALVLIGSPWLFWLLTYVYACAKGCCCREDGAAVNHQISRRPTTRTGGGVSSGSKWVGSSREPEMPLAYAV